MSALRMGWDEVVVVVVRVVPLWPLDEIKDYKH